MKLVIKELILRAAERANENGVLPSSEFPAVELEEPKAKTHGDLSTNMAMIMAKSQKMAPRKIAEAILAELGDGGGIIEKTEIAGPGFINLFVRGEAWHPVMKTVHEKGDAYGASTVGAGRRVQVEFVSANPTGPLHVGHGRGAVVGDTVANILSFCGYDVLKEYYINDSGRQINTLGRSVYLRLLEKNGKTVDFPDDCYQGDYIRDIAAAVAEKEGAGLVDMEEDAAVAVCARFAADSILDGIRDDLSVFGVAMEEWFSEQSLYDSGKVAAVIERMKKEGHIYDADGASWFKTSEFGDEKDRVVVRSNGQTTYFASDIAYHMDKFDRGFERVIDVWGADHHGYIPRINACIDATGKNSDQFDVILIKLVNLLRGGEPVAMSTRAGEFVTLRDVVDEVGSDAARFLFLTRHYESPLDFDLELAKKKTNENPVFYVQYVHARIASIVRKAADEKGIDTIEWDDEKIALLTQPEEIELIKALSRYPEVVEGAAEMLAPHRITFYLMTLASLFHSYYNKHKVLTDDALLTGGRLYLITAVKKVIRNGLALLGIGAPEQM